MFLHLVYGWHTLKKVYSALRIQYNNILRMLLGLLRYCSTSTMFAEVYLILHKWQACGLSISNAADVQQHHGYSSKQSWWSIYWMCHIIPLPGRSLIDLNNCSYLDEKNIYNVLVYNLVTIIIRYGGLLTEINADDYYNLKYNIPIVRTDIGEPLLPLYIDRWQLIPPG